MFLDRQAIPAGYCQIQAGHCRSKDGLIHRALTWDTIFTRKREEYKRLDGPQAAGKRRASIKNMQTIHEETRSTAKSHEVGRSFSRGFVLLRVISWIGSLSWRPARP